MTFTKFAYPANWGRQMVGLSRNCPTISAPHISFENGDHTTMLGRPDWCSAIVGSGLPL